MSGLADRPNPPQKRFTLKIELHAHDVEHALSLLDGITNDAACDGFPPDRISGGFRIQWTENDPTMTAERYERELMAWHEWKES